MSSFYSRIGSRSALILKSSSRATQLAHSDRYSLIHTFFTRPNPFSFPSSSPCPRPVLSSLSISSLTRHFHPSCRSHSSTRTTPQEHRQQPTPVAQPTHDNLPHDRPSNNLQDNNYPRFFRRLAQSLPHVSRPSRDDFLNAANGFVQRMRVRVRWFFIRNFHKFNADDISAFVTWFLVGQGLWILIGTTTFFSVVFAVANSFRLQAYVARAISDYLTSETGVTIIFESAIVPKWKDSRISFKSVYITRRPKIDANKGGESGRVAHAAALGYDVSNHPANHTIDDEEDSGSRYRHSDEDIKWSMFDLSVDSIDVTLSLWRWLDGKGLVKDAVVKGVRGVLDRRSVSWSPDLDPASFRHIAQPGDFELESLTLEDVLITVYQPGGFRPYTFSIFRADVGMLRKQWLFYDFLKSEGIVGQFDNCLFSLHRPQSIGRTNEQDAKDGGWSTMSRFRIDGVNIDHLQAMTTEEGPISWISSGKLDAVLDIKFPRDPDADALNVFIDALATTAVAAVTERIPGQRELAKPPLSVPQKHGEVEGQEQDKIVIDIDLRFRDLKAAVPIWTNELSYSSNALIRPIVAFMNANRTLIPVRCRVVKGLEHFDGSWTMWETGLMDDIAIKVYDAFAYHVTQANFNHRVKTVSLWSLQMTASAVLAALRNVVDPVSVQVRDLYQDAALALVLSPGIGEAVSAPISS
ncbi:mitochondrial distribution and morphology proteins-domain-containing protein [Multifurca ochricompacta]|uniref:Mitochondrial distribution and morphology proteins-domain-containing protein n=1 Tax=Multifurca ochricompacta TaxID=376703 RepID=A0AAD4QQR9_9AGAM|nr:mitochondrial distribution and morphology proteins-domain-containing protein [Multifurca ochricompacta]